VDVGAYDVIVCGAGPAGCSASLHLARLSPKSRIVMLDAASFPRHKVCGEFISAEAVALLDRLLPPAWTVQGMRIGRVRLRAGGSQAELRLRSPAISLSRYDLDEALVAAARRAGIEVHENTKAVAIRREGGGFEVVTQSSAYRARVVINATGRWSEIGQRGTPSGLIGAKAHLASKHLGERSRPESDSCDLHFMKGGYLGVQPISAENVNVSALMDARRHRTLESLLGSMAGVSLPTNAFACAPIRCAPICFGAPEPVRDEVLCCGDAAAFIDPFAGDGISLAVHSGAVAAEAAALFLRGAITREEMLSRYAHEYRASFGGQFRAAAWMRRCAFAPEVIQRMAVSALRVPPIASAAIGWTRARGQEAA